MPAKSEREEIMDLIRNEYDPAPSHYRMGDDWDDGAGRIADAILADKTLLLRKHAEALEEAGKAAIAIRNELDRTRAERASWEAQFHSAAAAASEYSEFWEAHHGDFDQFGNYIPYSQMDGDLRAAKAEIERLRASPTRS
jgi:hypothetical protein